LWTRWSTWRTTPTRTISGGNDADGPDHAATTTAAMSQVMLMPGITAPHGDQLAMVVNHPFLCAICDNETGAILFVGAIADPGDDSAPPIPAR
jgi:serine protease inhibitor